MQKREAEWILKEKYQGVMTPEAVLDIAKLKQGEHVDYIIGFTEFLGCKIDLSKRPMIPRPETEYWVEKAIQELWKSRSASVWCLDLFAGSGCIGIAVLGHIPFARVDFGEKEKKFADQIKINATLNRIDRKRYRVFQSDVFSKIPYKYDYIFANPPYVALSKAANVQKSVLDQEPLGAIFGGEDGLDCIRKFLKQAKSHLKKQGKLFLEFDSWQKPKIALLLKKYGFTNAKFFKDQYGKWRFLEAS